MALTAEQRSWLRAIRDRLAREALPVPYQDAPRCRGCGCRMHERTSGCQPCRARHFERRRQLRRLFAELRLPTERKAGALAARRQRVAELTRQGRSARQIAAALGVNRTTVMNDRRAIETNGNGALAAFPDDDGDGEIGETFRRVREAIGDGHAIDADEHALGITLDVLERRDELDELG